jgi:hypothetical protein
MAAEPFNSLGGFTVGIPPVSIVDESGNIITNVNFADGNVTANRVFANIYNYSNGVSILGNALMWTSAPTDTFAPGLPGQVAYDSGGNLFICVATDTWAKFSGTLTW